MRSIEELLELESKGLVQELPARDSLEIKALSISGKRYEEKINQLISAAANWNYDQTDKVTEAENLYKSFLQQEAPSLDGHILRVYRGIERFDNKLIQDLNDSYQEFSFNKLRLDENTSEVEKFRKNTDIACIETANLVDAAKKRNILARMEDEINDYKEKMEAITEIDSELSSIYSQYEFSDKKFLQKTLERIRKESNFFNKEKGLREKAVNSDYYEGVEELNNLEQEIQLILPSFNEYKNKREELINYENKLNDALEYVEGKKVNELSRQKRLDLIRLSNEEINIPELRYFGNLKAPEVSDKQKKLSKFLDNYVVKEKNDEEVTFNFSSKPKKREFSLAFYVESLGVPRSEDYFILRHILTGKTESNPIDMLEAYVAKLDSYSPINNEMDKAYFQGILRGLENASQTSLFEKVNPLIVDNAIQKTRDYINS